jgi:hypothetical protein
MFHAHGVTSPWRQFSDTFAPPLCASVLLRGPSLPLAFLSSERHLTMIHLHLPATSAPALYKMGVWHYEMLLGDF